MEPGSAGAAPALAAGFSFTGATCPNSNGAPASRGKVGMNLLMPKNIKWRKPHKPSIKPYKTSTKWKFRGYAQRGNKPHFGKYALQIMEEAWITSQQIEAMRRTIVRVMARKGKVWIRVFPHQAITQRVADSRMGAGKGAIEYWVAAVRPMFILFEIDGCTEDIAERAFRKCMFKLPVKARWIKKEDGPSMFELGLAGKEGRGGGLTQAQIDARIAAAKAARESKKK